MMEERISCGSPYWNYIDYSSLHRDDVHDFSNPNDYVNTATIIHQIKEVQNLCSGIIHEDEDASGANFQGSRVMESIVAGERLHKPLPNQNAYVQLYGASSHEHSQCAQQPSITWQQHGISSKLTAIVDTHMLGTAELNIHQWRYPKLEDIPGDGYLRHIIPGPIHNHVDEQHFISAMDTDVQISATAPVNDHQNIQAACNNDAASSDINGLPDEAQVNDQLISTKLIGYGTPYLGIPEDQLYQRTTNDDKGLDTEPSLFWVDAPELYQCRNHGINDNIKCPSTLWPLTPALGTLHFDTSERSMEPHADCCSSVATGSATPDLVMQDTNMVDSSCLSSSSSSPFVSSGSGSVTEQKEMLYRTAVLQPLMSLPLGIDGRERMMVKPKQRKNVRISKDPQSIAARQRRQRISDKMRVLQQLVPGGLKMDTASMLEEAVHYLKFLKAEVEKMEGTEAMLCISSTN